MFKKHLFSLYLLICLCYNCKSISVANESQTKTTQSIELGIIGEDKLFLLEEDYNSMAIPLYTKPIRLSVSMQEFNNSSFKAFTSANNKKQQSFNISYADSLKNKPKFLKLELADRVTVLNMLNDKQNSNVKDYLRNKKNAHLISALSIALSNEKMNAILDADVLFLEQDTNKTLVLKAYQKNQVLTSLKFHDGVVFAYQASNFCWQEDDKYQLSIVDIVESTDKCPNSTYRNAKRAKKNINYFKF
ncbi:hypothetical protein [Winogradskyella sp.]|uniref:hypothetical protein n=1 Tax=Winogradskyella sp. TaxID=1883156 RepID=UPI00260EC176|nr:hypothetical protein [Winogradskyella sp.]